ncbi:glycosyltransferase involved in cell wall biosynthesis [Salinibacter ruber]|uniref:glycosyltransferase family 2 protein n=1 Tax=Salinibacter ruber TaxID=146919 RepID=UPI002167D245|nr:glycosyltransferase family 2 protein [Salinibacter ruber]MCS3700192.1 glycosyltransferase involved in cell wall biosynthesis [Salinibacter ruber]
MSDPLVSVCMTAYNAEDYVAEALDSALAQTWANLEIVIANDGSTDDTGATVDRYAREHRKVTAVHQENRGHSAGMNRAYAESSGELIKFFDSDDLMSPEMVERQVTRLNGSRAHIASAEWGRFHEDPSEATFEPEVVWRDMDPADWLVTACRNARPMMQCAIFLIPRAILDRGWDESLSLINDFEFFARLLLKSEGVRFTPGARVYYRSGLENNLSGRQDPEAIESEYRSLMLGTQHLLDHENTPGTRRVAANTLQNFIHRRYPLYPDLRAKMKERVEELGGSDLVPSGPPGFEVLRPILGWRVARRIQRFAVQNGLNRASLREWFPSV